MIVSQMTVFFFITSVMGWLYECTYCMIKSGHWSNRGFLYGPFVPIYGFAATAGYLVFWNFPVLDGADTPWWEAFLICMIGSAVLEYSTSLILEKIFHARWWDYSNTPLNLNGRICLPASLGFGVGGAVIVRYLLPVLSRVTSAPHPLVTEGLSLACMFLLAADLALTIASLTSLLQKMESLTDEFNTKAEDTYQLVLAAPTVLREKTGDAYEQLKEAPAALKEKTGAVYEQLKEAPAGLKQKTEAVYEQLKEAPAALKNKTDEVRGQLSGRIAETNRSLNRRQQYALRSIERFTGENTSRISRMMQRSLDGFRDRAKEAVEKYDEEQRTSAAKEENDEVK